MDFKEEDELIIKLCNDSIRNNSSFAYKLKGELKEQKEAIDKLEKELNECLKEIDDCKKLKQKYE